MRVVLVVLGEWMVLVVPVVMNACGFEHYDI